MIALICAVPLETELLRKRLSPCEVRDCYGHDLYRGRLAGNPVNLLHCGIGKANAASAMTALLLSTAPRMVIMAGCGGAFAGSGLRIGDLALATAEISGDDGVLTPEGFRDMEDLGLPLVKRNGQRFFNRFPVDAGLLAKITPLLQNAAVSGGRRLALGPFVTVSTCSGTAAVGAALERRYSGICENMEGAAVAQVCVRLGVPFLELRGISNLVEDRDLSRWNLRAGAEAAQEGLLTILAGWHEPEEPA